MLATTVAGGVPEIFEVELAPLLELPPPQPAKAAARVSRARPWPSHPQNFLVCMSLASGSQVENPLKGLRRGACR